MKILIAITTGRPNFKDTLDLIAQNIKQFGHFATNFIGVAINYDTDFLKFSEKDFIYNTGSSRLFKEKIYLGKKNINEYINFMISRGIERGIADILSQSNGYSNKKNLILIEAMKRNYDIVLFWDDDEYPFVCLLSEDRKMLWIQSDIIGSHMFAYNNYSADMAFGFYTGYVSPIPTNFNQKLSTQTAKLLGDALSPASDVINPDTFTNSELIFKGAKQDDFRIQEIKENNGGKWISGGNLSVSIEAIKKGVIPPYFTPPNTRADDTLLSMGLQNAKVFQVPAGIFHDAFSEYRSIINNEFPINLVKNREVSTSQVERFLSVLRGWLGYAPIFLRVKNGSGYKKIINKMVKKLKNVDKLIENDLPEIKSFYKGQKPSDILMDFDSLTENQYMLMQMCYKEWKKLL